MKKRHAWIPSALQRLNQIVPMVAGILLLWSFKTSGLAQTIDLVIYDLVVTHRPAPLGSDQPITLIGIEEGDIRQFGWPINDALFCRAFDLLKAGGAAAIGFDIYRDKGVGENQQCLNDRFRGDPKLVSIFNVAAEIDAVPGTPGERQSYNDLSLDSDGVLRRDLVHVSGQDERTVSFPMRVMEVAMEDASLRMAFERGDYADAWLDQGSGGYQNESEAGLGMQRLLLFRQPGSYRQFSLSQLLKGEVPEESLYNQIVLIGSTAASLRDLFEVPHSRFLKGRDLFQIPGIEIHANRISSLLDVRANAGFTGWAMPADGNTLLLVLCGGLGLLLGEKVTNLRRSILIVFFLTVGLGTVLVTLLINHIWIGITMPLAGMISMSGTAWLRRGITSQLHSQQIRRLLGQTTSPAVAQQLWEKREELLSNGRFEGRQLPVTVLFLDTASFTSVSERLNPKELLEWLNRGMAICVRAVTKHGGMVNKFTGDGMLAVFGVPVPRHPGTEASEAIAAAREIHAGLQGLNMALRREGKPAMRMRIGLTSGEVLAGSIGSAERMEYAIIGDTVNCAARLESLSKESHRSVLRVLLCAQTLELLDEDVRNDLRVENWGMVQVKGRDQSLQVFELRMDNAREGKRASPV